MCSFNDFFHILKDEIQRKTRENVEGEIVVGHIFILSLKKVIMHILVGVAHTQKYVLMKITINYPNHKKKIRNVYNDLKV